MASIKEAFTNPDVAQGDFYSAQQIRYREVEPNRFLPDKMKGALGQEITKDALSQFDRYDPYTQKMSNKFSSTGLSQLLQGQGNTTNEETYCRGLVGAASLPKLIADQQAQGNSPIRCGWRYKPSPGGGAPQVSQGALGTLNGPLNPQADPLGNGVEWIWDLKKALNRHAKDFIATQPATASGLAASQAAFSNTAWCSQTNSYILVDANGRPLQGYTCAADKIVTNPARFPQVTQTSATTMASANSSTLANCSRPGNNPSLSRDCLLQAIKMNGCSSDGALYQAIESAKPSASTYNTYLQTQPSFTTYQSRQGANRITEDLFNKERGSWDMATNEIKKLQRYTQVAQDPLVKVAAQDLCLRADTFDHFDFCSDLTESSAIGSVDLKCMQSYWQEKNGKPAGLLYPTTRALKPALGTITTWGQFRTAVDQLKMKINSSNGIEQRGAINNFLGVSVSLDPFSPLQLNMAGKPLVFWIDANDGGSLVIDQNNRVQTLRDKSGRNNDAVQTSILNRPIYKKEAFAGLEFDGTGTFLAIPNAYQMVSSSFIVFVVERRKSSKGSNYFIGGTSAGRNSNLVLGYRDNNVATMAFFGNDLDTSVSNYQNVLEPIRIWGFEKATTGRSIYLNGERIKKDNNMENLLGWDGATIGRVLSSFYMGMIHEVLIYNTALVIDNREKIEGYLAHKWGQATNLSAGHPYKTASP